MTHKQTLNMFKKLSAGYGLLARNNYKQHLVFTRKKITTNAAIIKKP